MEVDDAAPKPNGTANGVADRPHQADVMVH
jgi:hypothetical protein